MNWYKTRKFADGIWEDLEEYGPGGKSQPMSHEIEKYKERNPDCTEEDIISFKEMLKKEPKEPNSHYGIHEWGRRDDFVKEYGWSVPSKKAIEKIKGFVGNDSIVEVGSGYGLWAKLLKDEGINIIATDAFREEDKNFVPNDTRYIDIENLNNEEAMEKYGDYSVLMMSWPPYHNSMSYDTISKFKGHKFIYIGEGHGGCTGGQDFHDALNREWGIVEEICIPQWSGLHDNLVFYQRK